MDFTLSTWQQAVAKRLGTIGDRLGRWKEQDAPCLLYGALCGLSLWPLVEAGQRCQPSNRGELYAHFVSRILRRDTDRRMDAEFLDRHTRLTLALIVVFLFGAADLRRSTPTLTLLFLDCENDVARLAPGGVRLGG